MVICAVGLGGLLLMWSPGSPRPFLDSAGGLLPGSVSEKIWVDINGVKQGMVIRGKNERNPVLLWVHGGPGMPDYIMTDQNPTNLEDLFTLVWWDQRGTALSYDPDIPPETMTIEQFVSDTLAVTDYLRKRFHQNKIYLLGHSWGSLIAIEAASDPRSATAPTWGWRRWCTNWSRRTLAYDYMLAEYRRLGDTAMVRDLEAAPVSMATGTPDGYLKLRDKAMHRLGVGTTHDMKSVITGLFLPSWTFPGYTLREKVALWRGRAFSRSFGLWDQLIWIDLRERIPRLEIPVYFLEGAYDYTCATELARDYFRKLDAPMKGFYEFGDSAHSPVLEEPTQAHRILQGDVLAGTNALADLK